MAATIGDVLYDIANGLEDTLGKDVRSATVTVERIGNYSLTTPEAVKIDAIIRYEKRGDGDGRTE